MRIIAACVLALVATPDGALRYVCFAEAAEWPVLITVQVLIGVGMMER